MYENRPVFSAGVTRPENEPNDRQRETLRESRSTQEGGGWYSAKAQNADNMFFVCKNGKSMVHFLGVAEEASHKKP